MGPLVSLARFVRSAFYWAPLWGPIAVGVQITLLGLRPAVREEARLEREEAALRAQYAELVEERHRLDLELEAQRDPLYIERERRALTDPSSSLR